MKYTNGHSRDPYIDELFTISRKFFTATSFESMESFIDKLEDVILNHTKFCKDAHERALELNIEYRSQSLERYSRLVRTCAYDLSIGGKSGSYIREVVLAPKKDITARRVLGLGLED